MKKLISILILGSLMLCIVPVKAQDLIVTVPGPKVKVYDTITSGVSKTWVLRFDNPYGKPFIWEAQTVGTVASGDGRVLVTVSRSDNGVNYVTMASDSLTATKTPVLRRDSLAFTSRYLKFTITGKAVTQKTVVSTTVNVLKRWDDNSVVTNK